MNDQTRLHFYASTPEACGYLPDRQSVSAFANPYVDMTVETYDELIQYGFRRSGSYLYRPHCPDCRECVSLRLPVSQFQWSRNDRRCLKRNADLQVRTLKGRFVEEHYQLYQEYINSRHRGGSMENPTRTDYQRFLICDWSDTDFIEIRNDDQLLGVAVTDRTQTGLSAVYTFFKPTEQARSLGHFAILNQIQTCLDDDLPYLYLGYWIKECDKMNYKTRYKPSQGFINNAWIDMP